MKKFLFLFLSLISCSFLWAQKHTVSGLVSDAASGETLIGATILDARSGKGTVSNVNGRFSLTLSTDTAFLKISFVGYESLFDTIPLTTNVSRKYTLSSAVSLREVVITADRPGDHRSSQMSAIQVPVEQLKAVPVMFGEADIVKALQLLPGVQSASDVSGGMYVRGGGPDENLYLLDGVPLYNVNHLGGFFSAFNTDAVKNVTLYKGSFPARFGGRLSSILDVATNDGNLNRLHGNASLGLVSAKVALEGPIVKDRTTFSLSARRTYADLFMQPIIKALAADNDKLNGLNAGYYFYDINAKLTHRFSDRSRIFAAFYMGSDYLYAKVRTLSSLGEDQFLSFNNRWGNILGAISWNYLLSPQLFMNLSASYTQYDNNIVASVEKLADINGQQVRSTMGGDYNSGIKDATLKLDFGYSPNPDHDVKFGSFFTRHWFSPEVATANVDYFDQIQMNSALKFDTSINASMIPANEIVLFGEDEWAINDYVKLNYGLHLSGFKVQNSFYCAPQPRVSARWLITDNLSLKVGYAYMMQYMHLLSTTNISISTDLWVPATDRFKPMSAHQVAAGVFYGLPNIADFSVEAYYKRLSNIIEYKDGATFLGASDGWEDLVVAGDGYAYGLEFLAQRSFGKFTGWVGYTLSRSMHLFNREGQQLNGGKPFPAKYDRRHDLSIVLSYKFNDNYDVSATWVFSTGNAATFSMSAYSRVYPDPDDYDKNANRQSLYVIEGRNNFRMPNYHRLDISANFHRRFKRCRRTINVSIYNVYNQQNPYMIYLSRDYSYRNYSSALVQLSIFPIIPSVSYTLYW